VTFVSPVSLLEDAQALGYAVPAFNTNGGSYDIARAALEACAEARSPLILQVYEGNCSYRGYRYFVHLAEFLCDEVGVSVPVALQLDHGHTFESVSAAMDAGFTAVMYDASYKPLDTNIAETARVVETAHAQQIAVEAEVGYVKGNEPPQEERIGRVEVPERPTVPPAKTDVAEAVRLVEAVGVDMLAVSIGTTHGVYRSQTGIDFALLADLRESVQVPLVQHGTGGVSLDDLAQLARAGMSKINFGEPFRYDYVNHFCELTDTMAHLWHPWRIMRGVKERLKASMREIIEACGAYRRA
jgi:ketose-bisphosphate aldolase